MVAALCLYLLVLPSSGLRVVGAAASEAKLQNSVSVWSYQDMSLPDLELNRLTWLRVGGAAVQNR
jgi:hypothetical protein